MITFFFSYFELGGVPTLFSNLARELYRLGINYRLIARKESAIHLLFEKISDNYCFIDLNDVEHLQKNIMDISQQDVLVITFWEQQLLLFKKSNPRILFWNVFPDTLKKSNCIHGRFTIKLMNKILFKRMIKKGGLVFMDDAPLNWLIKYNRNFNENLVYIPIPVQTFENLFLKMYCSLDFKNSQFNVLYIARAEEWKLFPLLKIILDLQQIKLGVGICLKVLTDDKKKVKLFLRKHSILSVHEFFKIDYIENIPNEQLPKFLLANVHLNIGMGTSCLEGAKVGIPSLLINPSYSLINGDAVYKLLYNVKNYNLGSFDVSRNTVCDKDLISMSQFFAEYVLDPVRFTNISAECFNYVDRSHNISKVTKNFFGIVQKTELRVQDVLNFVYHYTFFYKIMKKIKSS